MDAFQALGALARMADHPDADDYTGEDGLIYCGRCHTRKQMLLSVPIFENRQRLVPVTCQCRTEEIRREAEREEYENTMRALQRLRNASLMEKRFEQSTFEQWTVTPRNKRLYDGMRRYAENFDEMYRRNQGVLLYGPPGTGKTFAAACVANHLLDHMTPVVMTSFVKLLQIANAHEDEQPMIDAMNRARLLIIDDLGAERATSFAVEKVYNFIDSRYRTNRPMILTTNLTLDQLRAPAEAQYRRIYDRVMEICHPVEVAGKSWRMEEAARRFADVERQLFGEGG